MKIKIKTIEDIIYMIWAYGNLLGLIVTSGDWWDYCIYMVNQNDFIATALLINMLAWIGNLTGVFFRYRA